jgi:hypothetical protein
MEEQAVKLCPLHGFQPCLQEQCAWSYNKRECAITSLGFIDHTLRQAHNLGPLPTKVKE